MNRVDRRKFLVQSGVSAASIAAATAGVLPHPLEACSWSSTSSLSIAPFRVDVTPPMGHGCCGGWIKPLEAIDDAQEAIGFVLLGAGKPIVVCAVDWTGILNSAHVKWRQAMADAAGTTADRAAVQCVHQHNAPFACLDTEKLLTEQGDLPHTLDASFFERCLEKIQKAIQDAILKAEPVTHVGHGQGRVIEVASNRRVNLGPDGRIISMRGSSCTDPVLRAMPEGLVDPFLKTVAFYNGDRKLVCCHYYATHPMSYYGDGRATSDFVGLARKKRQADEPQTTHLYFTGCAGNVSAGKYNDGSKEMRPILTRRIYEGIVAADKDLKKETVQSAEWRTSDLLPTANVALNAETLAAAISNMSNPVVGRNRPAFELAWLQRLAQKTPIVLSNLRINDIDMLHLPAECFIEYQLRAQQIATGRFVATAAYGDGGPWYVPTKEAYPQGGYEVSVAFCDPAVDDELTAGIKAIL